MMCQGDGKNKRGQIRAIIHWCLFAEGQASAAANAVTPVRAIELC